MDYSFIPASLLPPGRRAAFAEQLRYRAIRGGIGAAIAFVGIGIPEGISVSLIAVILVGLVLYVPPWHELRYGHFVPPTAPKWKLFTLSEKCGDANQAAV